MPITRSHAKVTVGLFWAESWLFRSHLKKIPTSISFFSKVSVAQNLVTSATNNICPTVKAEFDLLMDKLYIIALV